MKFQPTFFFRLLCISTCFQISAQETRWIDDIVLDSTIDDPVFKICNSDEQIIQYFNDGKGIQYKGDKHVVDSIFYSTYKQVAINQSGLIRVRFIVNCLGETGRFRLISSDSNYNPFQFSPEITDQLLQITKSMVGWQPKIWKGMKVDYYQYLIFKIENGTLSNILP